MTAQLKSTEEIKQLISEKPALVAGPTNIEDICARAAASGDKQFLGTYISDSGIIDMWVVPE